MVTYFYKIPIEKYTQTPHNQSLKKEDNVMPATARFEARINTEIQSLLKKRAATQRRTQFK